MKAKAITDFRGVEDGKVYPRQISEGEIIRGDLARAEIASGRAVELIDGKKPPQNKALMPERNKSLPASQLAPASRKKTVKRSKKAG